MNAFLMRTPSPFEYESPRGYLNRLAEANGYESPRPILDLLRADSELRLTSGLDYTLLSKILGPCCELPMNFGYRVPKKQMREQGKLLDSPIQTRHLGLYKARICGPCLRELGYIPAAWDLKSYLACAVHGSLMRKHCGACGRRITYLRPGVCTCCCGADLRVGGQEPASPALVGLSEVLRALVEKRREGLLHAVAMGMPVEEFLQMDLDVFVRVVVTMANVLEALAEWKPTMRPYAQLVDAIPDVAEVFASWPKNFELLCALWHEHGAVRSRDDGFQTKFDWLFYRLHKNLDARNSQTTFMLEAACVYATRRWASRPFQLRSRHVDPANLPDRRYGSANDASKLLGMDPITAARWAAKGLVPARRCGKQGNRNWCVDLDAIRQMNFSAFPRVTRTCAAKEIGVSRPTFDEMNRQAIIASTYRTVGRPGGIAREDIDEFKRKFAERCQVPESGLNLEALSSRLSRESHAQQVRIIDGILRGESAVYGVAPASLKDVYVEKPRPKEHQPQAPPKPETHLGMIAVAKKYGLHNNEARAIFQRLGSRICGRRFVAIAIPKIENFMEEYSLVRRVADRYGILSIRLVRALRRLRPEALVSIAPRKGWEARSARFIQKKHLKYATGVARRLSESRARGT